MIWFTIFVTKKLMFSISVDLLCFNSIHNLTTKSKLIIDEIKNIFEETLCVVVFNH